MVRVRLSQLDACCKVVSKLGACRIACGIKSKEFFMVTALTCYFTSKTKRFPKKDVGLVEGKKKEANKEGF